MSNTISSELRSKVRERDRTCQRCGISNGLEAHHKILKMYGGQDTEENLIMLCHFCHEEWHYIDTFNRSIINQGPALTFEEWLKDMPALWAFIIQWRNTWPEEISAKEYQARIRAFWTTIRQLNIKRGGMKNGY